MKWRVLIVIAISVGFHLTLLAIHFLPNGRSSMGERRVVGLVQSNPAEFTPAALKEDQTPLEPKALAPRQQQPVNTLENNPTPPKLLPQKTVTVPDIITEVPQTEILSAPSLKREIPTVLLRDSPATETQKTLKLSSGNHSIDPMINKIKTVPAADVGQAQEHMNLSSAGVISQTLPLKHAVANYEDNPRPEYPEVARRKGWAGEVRLLVLVDEGGDVDKISINRSSGYSALDKAARRAVRLWRFSPAIEAGRKVASEVVVPIDFRLPSDGRSGKPE